jgi:GMP reductase
MSSDEAMKKYYGGKANYRASEGRSIVIPYKGNVSSTVEEYLGGLRSTMSYIGAERLKEIGRRITFVRVNRVLNTSLAK